MTDETVTELSEYVFPFGRQVRLLDVDYNNGLSMLRMIWREGKRITQVEIDPQNAAALGEAIVKWAQEKSPSDNS